MKKKILSLIAIFIIGGMGGILTDRTLLPFLSKFETFKFIGDQKNITQIIQKTEQIIVKENDALEITMEKVGPTVGVVLLKDKSGKVFNQFAGVSLTGDGLILTISDSLGKNSNAYFLNRNGNEFPLTFVKRDDKLGLAILKASSGNFATVPFAEINKTRIGESVFLLGAGLNEEIFKNFVNEGIVKSNSGGKIELNFVDNKNANGSSLFNTKGEMIGINLIGASGVINVVGADKIREFIK